MSLWSSWSTFDFSLFRLWKRSNAPNSCLLFVNVSDFYDQTWIFSSLSWFCWFVTRTLFPVAFIYLVNTSWCSWRRFPRLLPIFLTTSSFLEHRRWFTLCFRFRTFLAVLVIKIPSPSLKPKNLPAQAPRNGSNLWFFCLFPTFVWLIRAKCSFISFWILKLCRWLRTGSFL